MDSKNNGKNFTECGTKSVVYDTFIYFLIAAIAVFYAINNFIWLKLNVYPHGPDEFSHLLIAQNFLNGIISGHTERVVKLFSLSTKAIYPPFYHFIAAVLCPVTGDSSPSPLLINLLYALVLLFSVYCIGNKLYDKAVGMLAVLLVSLYPMVFRYSRFFGPDFAQMAMVCLSICCLLYTENFSNRKYSILFGISIGLGMLTKSAFLLFLAGPLGCVILQAFRMKKNNMCVRAVYSNVPLSLLTGMLISLTWYLPALFPIVTRLRLFSWTIVHSHPGQQSLQKLSAVSAIDTFFDYARLLVNEQISLFFFLVFLVAVPFLFTKRSHKLFLLSWYVLPYVILSLSSYKEGRFMLSSLPAVALISAAGLRCLAFPRHDHVLKHLFYALMLFLGLVQFFDISYNYGRKDKTFPFQTPVGIMHMLYVPITEHHGWAYGPPFKKNWHIGEIAASIATYNRNNYIDDSAILVGVIGEDDYVRRIFNSPEVINYYLAREDPASSFRVIDFFSLSGARDWGFIKKIDDLDYVVFISGQKSWPAFDDLKLTFNRFKERVASSRSLRNYLHVIKQPDDFRDARNRLRTFLDSKDEKFLLIARIKQADGYYANVYARRIPYVKQGN